MPANKCPTIEESNTNLDSLFDAISENIEHIDHRDKEKLLSSIYALRNRTKAFYKAASNKNNQSSLEDDYNRLITTLAAVYENRMAPKDAEDCLKDTYLYSEDSLLRKNLLRIVAILGLAVVSIASVMAAFTVGAVTSIAIPSLGLPVLVGTLKLAYDCLCCAAELCTNMEPMKLVDAERKMKDKYFDFFNAFQPDKTETRAPDSEQKIQEVQML